MKLAVQIAVLLVGFGSTQFSLALDANGNGMSDVWESLYPGAAANPELDDDGDGVINAAEAVAWTNPSNAASVTRCENPQVSGGATSFQWLSSEWVRYRVRHGSELEGWSWPYTPQTGNGARFHHSAATSGDQQFYTLQVMPPLNSDTDSLDNREEAVLGTNPQSWDSDGDKVADDVEFLQGSNPLVSEDTDGDGMMDDWERWIIHHDPNDTVTDLTDVTLGTDFDRDGIRDKAEFDLGTSPVNPKQNILFFLTEDQSYHLGCLGTKELDTPRLDNLGTNGLIFTRAFAGAPVCSPAKMSIYTGTMPHHNAGFQNVQNYPEGAFPLPPTVDPKYNDGGVHEDLPTFIEVLNDHGWFTAVSHKVHVEPVRKYPYQAGYGQPDTPATATGFINSLVSAAGDHPFFMMFNMGSPHLPFRSFPNKNGLWSGTGGLTGNGHVTNVDANQVEVPSCYPDVPGARQDIADYYGAIEVIDSIFGAVVDALVANNALTNTLIIFTGDHGIGLHRAKQSCYGLGLHVPLLMSGPGMAGGRGINHPVSHTDLAPTILDFAGLPPQPTMTGRSLLPIFKGAQDTFPDRPTMLTGSHHRYDARAVCDGRYYYIRNLRNVVGATLANPAQALNADSYQSTSPYFNRSYDATVAATGTPQRELLRLLVEGELPPEELYDMDTDLWMSTNLIAQPALQGVVEKLRGEMARWRMTTEDYQTSSSELVRRGERCVPPAGSFTVSAGPDQLVITTNVPVRVNLNGFTSDSGATSLWSKVSGPGAVVFDNASALFTTATFTNLGIYVLQLRVGTPTNTTSDTLIISVTEPALGNLLINPGAEIGDLFPWVASTTDGVPWTAATSTPRNGAFCFRWDDNLWVTSTGTLSQSVTAGIQGAVPFTASVLVAAEPDSGGIASSHAITLRLQWYSDVAMTDLIVTSTATLTSATGLSNGLSQIEISDTTPSGAQAVRFTVECTHTNPPDTSKTNFLLDDASLVLLPEE